jgi:hypothetical protein
LEPEGIEGEEVRINRKSSQFIGGKPQGKNERYKSIKFKLGEMDFEGMRDQSSNINILSYHAYTLCRYYLDDHELKPSDTTLVLSDRTRPVHGAVWAARSNWAPKFLGPPNPSPGLHSISVPAKFSRP